jgi:dihydroorotate dehydrogenase
MPDWFYRTVSRPLLFRLPAEQARDFALGFMGRLARLPLGPALIDFLGHMRADERLASSYLGVKFPTPVGIGAVLDGGAVALKALARFGVGFLEVGPVTVAPVAGELARRPEVESIWASAPPPSWGLTEIAERLQAAPGLGVPVIVRLGHVPGATPEQASEDCRKMIGALGEHATVFALMTLALAVEAGWSDEQWRAHVRSAVEAANPTTLPRPVLVGAPADLDASTLDRFLGIALEAGAGGALLDGSVRAEPAGRLYGAPGREAVLGQVRHLRQRHGERLVLLAGGGVHEPEHALELRRAGASLVAVDTGLVYTGPGLVKRANEALLASASPQPAEPRRPAEMTWFWTALMGAGMYAGSLLALLIASTRVVLHYDEVFVGMTRDELDAVNSRLLAFMAHDRVSLAGTMVGIGVLYLGLSLFGVRRGLHWAQQSIFISAFSGFGSFFLFLGFGYFDPFHAFVTAILFQFLLLGLHAHLGQPPPPALLDLRGDGAWLRSLWGQFILVLHACGVLGAGLVICGVGVTQVFVHEDLAFMQTTREALEAANPRLIPLVAHDRATFGGMLVASGLPLLTCALWGFRPGSAWLWWTMLVAGALGYGAAIAVHYAVGYTDLWHLTPAFGGLAMLLTGLGLSYSFLTREGAPKDR